MLYYGKIRCFLLGGSLAEKDLADNVIPELQLVYALAFPVGVLL